MCLSSARSGARAGALPDGAEAPEHLEHKLGPGSLVLVVGPSGAGKDTLIAHARARTQGRAGLIFPRRVVTRSADPGLEDHHAVSVATFQAMLADGRFALHWQAHGLHYGVPAEIDAAIGEGAVVVVNVSRSVITLASVRYADLLTVCVTAPPTVLAARLARRGRETSAEIEHRLRRAEPGLGEGEVLRIVNDGPVARAGDTLVGALLPRLDRAASLRAQLACRYS